MQKCNISTLNTTYAESPSMLAAANQNTRMEKQRLIDAANKIISNGSPSPSLYVEVLEFLRVYAGEKSSFIFPDGSPA